PRRGFALLSWIVKPSKGLRFAQGYLPRLSQKPNFCLIEIISQHVGRDHHRVIDFPPICHLEPLFGLRNDKVAISANFDSKVGWIAHRARLTLDLRAKN